MLDQHLARVLDFKRVAESQGLTLRTGFFRLDWTLHYAQPTVVIDGHPNECAWGEHFFPLETGHHQVEIYYRCLGARAGKASAAFHVALNEMVKASYQAPNSIVIGFLPGKLTLAPSD